MLAVDHLIFVIDDFRFVVDHLIFCQYFWKQGNQIIVIDQWSTHICWCCSAVCFRSSHISPILRRRAQQPNNCVPHGICLWTLTALLQLRKKKIKHYLCQTYHTLHRKNAEYTHTRLAYRYDVWCCTKCFDNWTIGRGNIPCRVGFGLCGVGREEPTFGCAQLQYLDQAQNTCIM